MRLLWHPQLVMSNRDLLLPGYSPVPFFTWAVAKAGKYVQRFSAATKEPLLLHHWKTVCAICGCQKCQVEHWIAGHKVDCEVDGHWIEKFFPGIRANAKTSFYFTIILTQNVTITQSKVSMKQGYVNCCIRRK